MTCPVSLRAISTTTRLEVGSRTHGHQIVMQDRHDRQRSMCLTISGVVGLLPSSMPFIREMRPRGSRTRPRAGGAIRIKLKMPRTARVTSCVSRPVFPCPVRSSCDRGRWLHVHRIGSAR